MTDKVPTDYYGRPAAPGMYVNFTDAELNWLRTSPQGIQAAADYHSVQETEAFAQDALASGEYHKARRLELEAQAEYITKTWEES